MSTNIQTLALAKAAAKLETERPNAGKYEVDTVVSVRLKGTLSVGNDTEKTPTVSIPLKEVLALFIQRSGITREASLKLLKNCLTDALSKGEKGTGAIAGAEDIDNVFSEAVTALTKGLPKTPVNGAVSFKGEVTVL